MPSESPEAFAQIRHRIVTALDAMAAMGDGDDEFEAYVTRQAEDLCAGMTFEQLRISEKVAMVAILGPARARVLGGEGVKNRSASGGLRLVR